MGTRLAAYVTKDQAETGVLFELRARYERRSMLIAANQLFGEWNRVSLDPAMTLAAIDRLVHHATNIAPGKPIRLRDECLNEHLFANLNEARQIIEKWRIDYNRTSEHPSVYVVEEKRLC